MYKRRVSWLGDMCNVSDSPHVDMAIVEYIGSYPGSTQHGLGKDLELPVYTRTNPDILEKVRDILAEKPKDDDLYDEYGNVNGPRDQKEILNVNYQEEKQQAVGGDFLVQLDLIL